MRGKLTTIKTNFDQTEDFIFKSGPMINPELDNPAINVPMDKNMLKLLALELPKSQSSQLLDCVKSYITSQKKL